MQRVGGCIPAPWSDLPLHAAPPPRSAATKHGAGRALHFTHDGMLGVCSSGCATSGFGRLVYNAALWAGSVRREAGQPIRVAGSTSYGTNIAGHLQAHVRGLGSRVLAALLCAAEQLSMWHAAHACWPCIVQVASRTAIGSCCQVLWRNRGPQR